MKNSTIWIIVIVVIVVALGGVLWWKYGSKSFMPGSDRDSHGCIASAGYTWCDAKSECIRDWEELCTTPSPTAIGGDKDSHGCIASAGYTWCDSSQKCLRVWEEPCTSATSSPTSQVVPPKYLSQMDDCVKYGGQVQETQKDMGTWQAIDQWKCVCATGQTFSTGLTCNEWQNPATK